MNDRFFSGWRTITGNEEVLSFINDHERFPATRLGLEDLVPNEFVIFQGKDEEIPLTFEKGDLRQLIHYHDRPLPAVEAKSARQACYADALLNPDIPYVFCMGPAGTSKTWWAAYTSLLCIVPENKAQSKRDAMQDIQQQISQTASKPERRQLRTQKRNIRKNGLGEEQERFLQYPNGNPFFKRYNNVIYTRPMPELDGELQALGITPGGTTEKQRHGFTPMVHQYNVLARHFKIDRGFVDENLERGHIQLLHHEEIQGISPSKVFMIVSEAENLPKKHMPGYLNRAAHGTKMLIEGDPSPAQVRLKNTKPEDTGILDASQRQAFIQSPLVATMTFLGEDIARSPGAQLVYEAYNDLYDSKGFYERFNHKEPQQVTLTLP